MIFLLRAIVIILLFIIYNIIYKKYYDILSNYGIISIIILMIIMYLSLLIVDKLHLMYKKK
jgi:hypothetical protein